MSLCVSRQRGERVIIQTADSCTAIEASGAVKVRIDAPSSALILREELAEVCDVCKRWTLRGPCSWCVKFALHERLESNRRAENENDSHARARPLSDLQTGARKART